MKQFLVILGLTALVWLGVSMSETVEYRQAVKVSYTGYDTIRYAAVAADTLVEVAIASDGFSALAQSLSRRPLAVSLATEGTPTRRAVAAERLYQAIQERWVGVKGVSSRYDSLRLTLAERSSRTFSPSIADLDITFAEQYGLYGQPQVSPAEVTLYGPEEVLAQIDEVRVAPAAIHNLTHTASYTLPLDPTWRSLGDVYASVGEVEVSIPVETYIEQAYRVPITVMGADSTVQLRLYPTEATVHVWVARRDLQRTPEFTVTLDYADIVAHKEHLSPTLALFPSYLRPRRVEPKEVQCVIIK